jgi:tetratricopeptide (TPR) repeat protein
MNAFVLLQYHKMLSNFRPGQDAGEPKIHKLGSKSIEAILPCCLLACFLIPTGLHAAEGPPNGFHPERWTVKVRAAGAAGSGVVVKSDQVSCLILTAGHVVSSASIADHPYIILPRGDHLPIQQIRMLQPLDLAELRLSACGMEAATVVNSPHQGGQVWIAGYPQESSQFWIRSGPSEAQGASKTARPGGYALFHGASSRTGLSGAGVYNSSGELIGIHGEADIIQTASGASFKSGIGLAIPIDFWSSSVGDSTSVDQYNPQKRRLEDGLMKAAWLESMGRSDEALIELEVLIRYLPADERPHIRRGGLLLSKQRYSEALDEYLFLERSGHDGSIHQINRGNALFGLGRFAEALKIYTAALAHQPRLPWGHLNRAKALMAMGKFTEASASLDEALRLAPMDPAALWERSGLLLRKNMPNQALIDLNRLINNFPLNAAALERRGVVRGELGDLPGSVDDLTAAINLEPNNINALINRGVTLSRMRAWSEAEKDLNTALTRRPDDSMLMANLGEVIFLSGRQHEGCALAGKAVKQGFNWTQGVWNQDYRRRCQGA